VLEPTAEHAADWLTAPCHHKADALVKEIQRALKALRSVAFLSWYRGSEVLTTVVLIPLERQNGPVDEGD
jgi:hypothetical protein